MEWPTGPGKSSFGPVSIGAVVLLVLLVAAAIWVGRHPRLGHTLWARVRAAALVRRVRVWSSEQFRARESAMARWLPAYELAGIMLLVELAVVVALAAGFTAVLEDVLEGDGIAGVDRPAAEWLGIHRDPWLTMALRVITAAGGHVVLAALAVLTSAAVALRRRSWLPIVLGLVGVIGIGLVIVMTKALVVRDRPPIPYAVVAEKGFSFPSGHATGTAAVALLSAWMLTRYLITWWAGQVVVWTVAIGLIGAVGFSRVYLGVHYVSDVLAGWLLGTAWAGGVMMVGRWWDRHTRRARTSQTASGEGMA